MINLLLWISSLFVSTPREEKPIKVYQDPECAMSIKDLKKLKGKPDDVIECYDERQNLRYGDTLYYFRKGAYMGTLPLHRYIAECVDNDRVPEFKSACK